MTTKNGNYVQDADLMAKLKELILHEDRDEIARLREIIENPLELSIKVQPIIEERLDFLKKNFPKEFKTVVNQLVEDRIKSSQNEILDTIYPVLGKMIQKYINYQFQMLKDAIDKRIEETLGRKSIVAKVRMKLFGVRESDILLSNLDRPQILEVYVIQRDSGLLLGSASIQETMDKDLIAGMLTAIKAFVEDAFKRENQDLEMVKYGNFQILLQNYHSYYISVAMSGSISTKDRNELSGLIHQFSERELRGMTLELNETQYAEVSKRLESFFMSQTSENQTIELKSLNTL